MTIFNADDGRHAYFVSARNLDHAKQILADADVSLHCPDGLPRAVHHEAVNHPTMWLEIDDQRATQVIAHGMATPLSGLCKGAYVRVSKST